MQPKSEPNQNKRQQCSSLSTPSPVQCRLIITMLGSKEEPFYPPQYYYDQANDAGKFKYCNPISARGHSRESGSTVR
jgi:hypothetical protein